MESKYRIPLSAIVFNYLIYIAPIGFLVFEILLTGTIGKDVSGAFFLNPFFLISAALTVATPTLLCGYVGKSIAAYDGSEESCRRANRAVLLFAKLSIYCPILMSFMPFVAALFVEGVKPSVIFMQSFGACCFMSLASYIRFIQIFEDSLDHLPLTQKDTSMSLVLRSSLVGFFVCTGGVLILCAPLVNFNSPGGVQFSLSKLIPLGICSMVLGTLTCMYLPFTV